jgi:hypothetical protein
MESLDEQLFSLTPSDFIPLGLIKEGDCPNFLLEEICWYNKFMISLGN